MAKTRAALIDDIRRDVPFVRLFAAMCAVLRERSGSEIELDVLEPEGLLDESLQRAARISAPGSSAPSRSAGCGGTTAAPT